jgi:serine/threonine-protein kinase
MATPTRMAGLGCPFLDAVRRSGLLTPDDLVGVVAASGLDPARAEPLQVAALLVRKKLLTKFQAMQLLQGRTHGFVLDGYRILEGVRQDRVGMVFVAEDARTRERVAVKVLPTDRVSDPTVLKAFLAEARAASRAADPGIARVRDVRHWQGTHFVVSDYVPGPTLDKLVAERGPLVPDAAAQLVAQAAAALHAAHGLGLLHRDVKPANLTLLPGRRVKLLDLGLTHMLDSPWARVTMRISTKEYAEEIAHIPPEQAWGCEMDARSDVYGLGSTFYYLLTGRVPFPGLAPEMMAERQIRGVPSPAAVRPKVSAEIDAIVRKLGAKDPHERYPSAAAVLQAMQAWLPLDQWRELRLTAPAERADVSTATPPPAGPPKSRGFFARLFGR